MDDNTFLLSDIRTGRWTCGECGRDNDYLIWKGPPGLCKDCDRSIPGRLMHPENSLLEVLNEWVLRLQQSGLIVHLVAPAHGHSTDNEVLLLESIAALRIVCPEPDCGEVQVVTLGSGPPQTCPRGRKHLSRDIEKNLIEFYQAIMRVQDWNRAPASERYKVIAGKPLWSATASEQEHHTTALQAGFLLP